MISAEKMRKYFSRKYSDRNTAKMITNKNSNEKRIYHKGWRR